MPGTASTWYQASPNTDGQFTVGMEYFRDLNAVATLVFAGGILTLNAASGTAPNLVATLDIFTRTGMQINHQENYGTAASKPGPYNSVTNSPGGLTAIPPVPKSKLATLTGGQVGFVPKGIQLNAVTVLYKNTGAALTSFNSAIYANTPANGAASPAQIVLLPLGANGLLLPVNANIQAVTITIPTAGQVMLNTVNQQVIFNLAPTVGTGGTFVLYGVEFQCNFNFN